MAQTLTTILTDRRLLNYVVMILYLLVSAWWAYHRSWADVWYWLSALSITAAVTWGFSR